MWWLVDTDAEGGASSSTANALPSKLTSDYFRLIATRVAPVVSSAYSKPYTAAPRQSENA